MSKINHLEGYLVYKTVTKCRVCGATELVSVMDLGEQVLTGVFPRSKDEEITSGPVEIVKCCAEGGCGLVQLRQSYNLDEMYGMNYGYRSGLNPSMVNHLRSKVAQILSMEVLQDGDLIIDIGSNDATTLRAYPSGKYQLVGVDPTGVKFESYYTEEIELISDFFSAENIKDKMGEKKSSLITSFSMFYDLEDPVAFACEIESTLTDEGVWIFEQSYLPAMLRANSFDTICHEHIEFYALKQISWITAKAGLKVLDVEFNEINGGSFCITACKAGSSRVPNTLLLDNIAADEEALGLEGVTVFKDFQDRVKEARTNFMDFLFEAKSTGKRVCGLGASTKGNVLLQYYGIDDSLISEIGEVNEDKFGTLTPGTLIPLSPETDVLASDPDYLVILPWHFRSFFENLPAMKGRNLVFPLPNFEVVKT